MKKSHVLMMSAAMTLAGCAGAMQEDNSEYIGKSDIRIEGKRLTPEGLWAMGRIGEVVPSPDGKLIAFGVTYYSVELNKSNTEIFVMNADGTGRHAVTHTNGAEFNIAWIKGGKKLAFLSAESGQSQVWEMNADGSNHKKLSAYDGDIEGFAFSPDEKKLLFVAQVKVKESATEKYADLPKTTGIIVDDLMYKHWDEWVETAPHPFVADFDGYVVTNVKDIMEGEPYESPMKPFGGMEQLTWSPASDKVAYTCRKKVGLAYSMSTNSDIYVYDVNSGETKNMTEGMMGYDINPQFSADGNYLAWQSMERDGYESDWNRLFVMDLKDGSKHFVSEGYPSNVDQFIWNKESDGFFFTGVWHGESHIYALNLQAGMKGEAPTKLTEGQYDYASLALCGDVLITKRHSMVAPDDIYAVPTKFEGKFAEAKQLTTENKHIFDQIESARVEGRWVKTTDGKDMLTWVIYPPQFDPNKKYPAILFCEGGPQTPVSQFWSYRWNFQMMAANDYIIVAPNRRGLPGFGVEWNEAISGDYGGQCMRDYFAAIDDVAKEAYVDKDKLGCVGASFGGYSVYWLAGHHDKRFKAFIAHDGIFNTEMQYLETEEKWFANWDFGGAYWEKDNAIAQRTYANSPHRFVDKWDTPILCIHGEKDYRILANQAMAAFDAAKMRGVPAQLLIFPDENHWVLRPQNGILWQRTFFAWLDKWLK